MKISGHSFSHAKGSPTAERNNPSRNINQYLKESGQKLRVFWLRDAGSGRRRKNLVVPLSNLEMVMLSFS